MGVAVAPFTVSPLLTAQVEVLSAALRASSLDAHEETSGVEQRSELQDEVCVSELPDCNINHDTCVPLISAAEEVSSLCGDRGDRGDRGGQHSDVILSLALPLSKVKIVILTSSILVTLASY